jgi:hypothetical protein
MRRRPVLRQLLDSFVDLPNELVELGLPVIGQSYRLSGGGASRPSGLFGLCRREVDARARSRAAAYSSPRGACRYQSWRKAVAPAPQLAPVR